MLDDFEASEIASAWHSVNTWNDPGVAMYSVTSTGKVHSEAHRHHLIDYIDECLVHAAKLDADGDSEPVLMESNVEDLEALKEWAQEYVINQE
jgi:hypothetical protein